MTLWRREPATLWRRSGQQVVLLPPDADDALVLGGVAALVWLLLEEPLLEDELMAGLAEDFDREQEEIARELRAFAAELESRGALRIDGDRPPSDNAVQVSP